MSKTAKTVFNFLILTVAGIINAFGVTFEILSVLFAKKLNISVGMFVMCFNVVLYIVAGVALSSEFNNGITLLNAKGYFSNSDRTLIYFVVNRFQISKVRNIVREQDKGAYITITDVSDVLGSEK